MDDVDTYMYIISCISEAYKLSNALIQCLDIYMYGHVHIQGRRGEERKNNILYVQYMYMYIILYLHAKWYGIHWCHKHMSNGVASLPYSTNNILSICTKVMYIISRMLYSTTLCNPSPINIQVGLHMLHVITLIILLPVNKR